MSIDLERREERNWYLQGSLKNASNSSFETHLISLTSLTLASTLGSKAKNKI